MQAAKDHYEQRAHDAYDNPGNNTSAEVVIAARGLPSRALDQTLVIYDGGCACPGTILDIGIRERFEIRAAALAQDVASAVDEVAFVGAETFVQDVDV